MRARECERTKSDTHLAAIVQCLGLFENALDKHTFENYSKAVVKIVCPFAQEAYS